MTHNLNIECIGAKRQHRIWQQFPLLFKLGTSLQRITTYLFIIFISLFGFL